MEMRAGLEEELGVTSCAGVASNKLLAKLVSGTHKPHQQTLLYPHHTALLLGALKSVRQIPGKAGSL